MDALDDARGHRARPGVRRTERHRGVALDPELLLVLSQECKEGEAGLTGVEDEGVTVAAPGVAVALDVGVGGCVERVVVDPAGQAGLRVDVHLEVGADHRVVDLPEGDHAGVGIGAGIMVRAPYALADVQHNHVQRDAAGPQAGGDTSWLALMIEDGLWSSWRSRWALYRVLGRIFARLTPRLLRILGPSYDPRDVPDPAWADAWRRRHGAGEERLGDLDMARLGEAAPVPRVA